MKQLQPALAHRPGPNIALMALACAATLTAEATHADPRRRHRAQAEPAFADTITGYDKDHPAGMRAIPNSDGFTDDDDTGIQGHSADILADPSWIPNGDGITGGGSSNIIGLGNETTVTPGTEQVYIC